MQKSRSLQLLSWVLITLVIGFSCVQAESVQDVTSDAEYCKNATVCSAAPKNFTLLLDFIREMTNSIKTIWTEWDYVGQYVNPNRYEGNVFVAPQNNLVGKLARNVAQKVKFWLASTAIFSTSLWFWALKEIAGGTVLVTKNKVFLRDSKIVEDLESQLNTKRYELGLWWWFYVEINDANRAIMQGIVDKYIKKWLLTRWTVSKGTVYNNVTALLVRTLSAAKTVLYFDTVSQFDEFARWGADGISITFNTESMQTIQKDYSCARWRTDVCDKNKKTFKIIWQNLKASLTTSPYASKKVFTDALTRLGVLFSVNKNQEDQQKYKDREYELLKSTYGTAPRGVLTDVVDVNFDNSELKQVWTAIANDASAVGNAAWVVWKTIAKTAVWLWKLAPKSLSDQEQEINDTQKENVPEISTATTVVGEDLYNQMLLSYVQDVFANQANDYALATFAEVKSVTPAFKIIGNQIRTIKTDVLGGKNKDGTLIKSLWEACDAQCGWGGRCR